jgi:hypothetical protein
VGPPEASSFHVISGRSAVLVRARSSVGPISFATNELEGVVTLALRDQLVDTAAPLGGRLVVPLTKLTSGNGLYDTELHRRVSSRRFPLAVIELSGATSCGSNRYELTGEMEFHNVVRTISGFVSFENPDPGSIVIRGERTFDVRDFNLEIPTSLSLKFYPEVSVEMHLEASVQ